MSKILWFSWKDITNPNAGGAEVVSNEIQKRLALKNTLVLITSSFPGSKKRERIDNIEIIRLNSPRSFLPLVSLIYYIFFLRGKFELIIEEINTAPYFLGYFKNKEKIYHLYHQLAEEVWNYETPFPLNYIGRYILEPIALKLSSFKNDLTFAMSNSTKKSLQKYGYHEDKIKVLPEATNIIGLNQSEHANKASQFTVLYFGSMRRMKRPEHVVEAFAMGLKNTSAKLVLAGTFIPNRKKLIMDLIHKNELESQTTIIEGVSNSQKREIFNKAHVVCMTSIKEGWGLVILEAGLFETPAVAYDADGLRDAIINKNTGIIVKNGSIENLGKALKFLFDNSKITAQMGIAARTYNESFSFDKTYAQFEKHIN